MTRTIVGSGPKDRVYISFHVDDDLITGPPEKLRVFEELLMNEYEIRYSKPVDHFLGISVGKMSNGGYQLHQEILVDRMLDTYKVQLDKSKTLPHDTRVKDLNIEGEPEEKFPKYRSLLGGLQFLSTNTRPDITQAVAALSRYQNAPHQLHWDLAIHILQYVANTKRHGLYIPRLTETPKLTAYVDANHPVDRPVSGGMVFLGTTPISWWSKDKRVLCGLLLILRPWQ